MSEIYTSSQQISCRLMFSLRGLRCLISCKKGQQKVNFIETVQEQTIEGLLCLRSVCEHPHCDRSVQHEHRSRMFWQCRKTDLNVQCELANIQD